MLEKRKHNRKKTTFYMKVYDNVSEKMAGNLRDISTGGIKLNSPEPFKEGEICQFNMALPDALIGEVPITIKAKSIWCQKNKITRLYDTGFMILSLSQDNIGAIKNSLNSYLFKGC
jgi:hypothetical protein